MKKILVWLLVLTMMLALLGCGGSEKGTEGKPNNNRSEAKGLGVMTYAEYLAAPVGSKVVIEAYIQAKQAWFDDQTSLYTQDKEGAYFIDGVSCSYEDHEKLQIGAKIKVTGTKTVQAEQYAVSDGAFEVLSGSYLAEPLDVTELIATEEIDDTHSHQSELVSVKGATVVPSYDIDGNEAVYLYNWDGSGQEGRDLFIKVSVNDVILRFCVESYLYPAGSEIYEAVKSLQIGDVIDVEGFLCWMEKPTPHITAVTRVS